MNRGMKYRIYPTKEQASCIMQTAGCARFVYNDALKKKQDAYRQDKTVLTSVDLIKMLPAMKKDLPWLKDAESTALQQSIRHLDTAFKNFFEKRGRYPKFKKKRSAKRSYTIMNVNSSIRVTENGIRLPKIGSVKAVIHREIPDGWVIKSATVTAEHDGTFTVSVLCEYEITLPAADVDLFNAIGLDYKSDGLYMDSNGNTPGSPKFFRKAQDRLTKAQRGLRHKQKGSKNFGKQKLKIAKVHSHVKNQRKDFLHKLSTAIAKQYSIVCVEDLDLKEIAKRSRLGKSTMDNGYGMFVGMLAYKLPIYGHILIKTDKWYPSSQLCHSCGYQNPEVKDLNVRKWTCPKCGTVHDRDVNAAINIRDEGIRMYQAA